MSIGGLVFGGDEGDRTPDLCIANAALSQLSYPPTPRIEDLRLHQTVGDEVCLNFSKKARVRPKKVCLEHGYNDPQPVLEKKSYVFRSRASLRP